ncbi:MAG: type II secretion system minor pseudopilin GspH [Sulfuriflexus sp.]|nr:type II secretion system minor pseudopilin GspH [Sulfuriflexus sp.]
MFRRTQGFTLLELLIVLVILGITISFTVLSFGLKNPQDELKEHGQRIAALMQLASEESILLGAELAMQFNNDSYLFLNLKEDAWLEIANDPIFRQREFPEHIQIDVSVEGIAGSDSNIKQRVYFYSSGEASPFILTLSSRDTDANYKVTGDSQAVIKHGDK